MISFSTSWGCELACASIAVPACCSTCCCVNVVISDAMLTSWMLLSDEDMFSCVVEIAVAVYWRRFWTAPRVAASDEMLLIAAADVADRAGLAQVEHGAAAGGVGPGEPGDAQVRRALDVLEGHRERVVRGGADLEGDRAAGTGRAVQQVDAVELHRALLAVDLLRELVDLVLDIRLVGRGQGRRCWYCTASSLTRWSMLWTLFSALSAVWTIEAASLTFRPAWVRPLTWEVRPWAIA